VVTNLCWLDDIDLRHWDVISKDLMFDSSGLMSILID